MEEQYYFVSFEFEGKIYLLYDEYSRTFPATTTKELADDLCEMYFWATELAVDFVSVLMTVEQAKERTGIPFKVIDFFVNHRFQGVPI